MEKTVEAVLGEALETLRRDGTIDVDQWTKRYPNMAGDLHEILPVMISVRANRELHRTALKTSIHAISLFSELRSNAQTDPITVGVMLRGELDRSGLPLEEKAEQMGLSENSLKQLLDDGTPADSLDNLTIKRLSDKVGAPVAAMVMELRKLVSLYRSAGLRSAPQQAFTRSDEESSIAEKVTLLDRVRRQDVLGERPPSRGR